MTYEDANRQVAAEEAMSPLEREALEIMRSMRREHLSGDEFHARDLEKLAGLVFKLSAELAALKIAHLREWDAFYQRNNPRDFVTVK